MNKVYPNILKHTVCQKICINKESTSKTAHDFDIPLKTVEKWVTKFNHDPSSFTVCDDYYKQLLKEKDSRYDSMSVPQLIAELKKRDIELDYLRRIVDLKKLSEKYKEIERNYEV